MDFLRRHWKLLTALFVVALGLLWLNQYGFIAVEVREVGGASGDFTYELYNQRTQKTQQFTSDSNNFRKLVPKSAYQVTVRRGQASAFVVSTTPNFLRTASVTPALAFQQGREFAGYSPRGCLYTIGQTVYSYDCGGSLDVTEHTPSSINQPTYAQKKDLGIGTLFGVVQTKDGTVALAQRASEDFEEDDQAFGAPTIHLLGASSNVVRSVPLTGIDPEVKYDIRSYRDGFLIYDQNFSNVWHYASLSAKPERVTFSQPQQENQQPFSFSVNGNLAAAIYSDKADYEPNTNPRGIGKVTNEVMVRSGSQQKTYLFNRQLLSLYSCGTQKFCALEANTGQLLVYQSTDDQPKPLYVVQGVGSLWPNGQSVVITRGDSVVEFNPDTASGRVVYESTDASNCGLLPTASGYLVCTTDQQGKAVILRLNKSGTSDEIDQKVNALSEVENVNEVLAYGSLIHVFPDLGEMVYDSSNRSFDYNPVTKERVGKALNQEIDRIGFDRSKYRIIVNGL